MGRGMMMSDFEKELHAMFDHIWDCEIDHPVFQDTVGDLMKAVIQAYEKHNLTLGTNLAEVGTDCISRQAAIDSLTEYGNGRAVFISVGEAVIRIEQLPPIQPEILPMKSVSVGLHQRQQARFIVEFLQGIMASAIIQDSFATMVLCGLIRHLHGCIANCPNLTRG